MTALAQPQTPADLASKTYALYEQFRPAVSGGVKGWGAAGSLSLPSAGSLINTRLTELSGSVPESEGAAAPRLGVGFQEKREEGVRSQTQKTKPNNGFRPGPVMPTGIKLSEVE